MKFFCNTHELSDAINVVSKALTKKNTPILEGIKIEAVGSYVVLTATDLELFIEKKINAEVLVEGEVVVPGRFFGEYIRKLTSIERIEIEETVGDAISVKYGESKGEIKCYENTFPKMSKEERGDYIKIKEKDLKEILDKTIFCVAADATKNVIKGCLLRVRDGILKAAALDGYRLAVNQTEVETNVNRKDVIVAGRILSEVIKILDDTDNEVEVLLNERNIVFNLGHTIINSVLMEGEYIKFEDLIQKEFETTVTVKISEILDSMDRVTLISRGRTNNRTKLKFGENQINIKVESDIGIIDENIVAKIEGKDLEIAFNSKYFCEALGKIKKDYCVINLKSSNSPAVIKEVDSDNTLFMILPVRIV